MSTPKQVKKCPQCGSRNLQVDKHSHKGRVTVTCSLCDYVFEIRDEDDRRDRKSEKGVPLE